MSFALAKAASPHFAGQSKALKQALYEILFGIQNTWQLGQSDLAAILHRSESTISDWKSKKSVSVSAEPSPNDLVIYEFIEFYDSLCSTLGRVEDQLRWLKQISPDFGGESPLELIQKHPKNLYILRDWLDRASRP
jgi:hypothetical protein